MRRIKIIIWMMSLGIGWIARGQIEPQNGILAVVNDQVITRREVEAAIRMDVESLIRKGLPEGELREQVTALQKQRIEELVNKYLILNDFPNAGYNLPESVIDDRVQDKIRQEYGGDRAVLIKTLQEKGVTYEQFKKNLRENIIVSVLRDKHVRQQLIISPQKIDTYYQAHKEDFKEEDTVTLRMMEFTKSKERPTQAAQLAKEVLAKLDSGASFEEMAATYSDGALRAKSGNYGKADRKILRKELADQAFKLQAGQRSGIIELPQACYIMAVDEVRLARIRPLTEVRDQVERVLISDEQDRLIKKWLDRLRNKAFVRYF